jgi:cytochrome c peroxidase
MARFCICTVFFVAWTMLANVGFAQTGAAAPPEAIRQAYARPPFTPFPADNPYSMEKIHLGWMLFFDPRLSVSDNISCSTCHNPALSWGDGMATGIGHGASQLGRRTPTVANLAWADRLMWDGRKTSLEDQAFGPIETDAEMAMPGGKLLEKLQTIPEYRVRFAAAFPVEGLTKASIAKALATYERTIVSGIAPFDRWLAGDATAISDSAQRGFALFNGRAGCNLCHEGWSFTDHAFHDIGLPDVDVGRGKHLNLPSMQHAFKTPTLRDIARRSPYMHNGSIKTLRDVILHYDRNFVERPSLAPEVKSLKLTDREVDDLAAFLETLTGEQMPVMLPLLPAATH